jgi:thiol-disulfide isomerase/thioredoxin
MIVFSACSNEAADTPNPESLIGTQAPQLSGDDLTGAGVTTLGELEGKPTVVVFWLNTCPHCQESLPEIQTAWADLADDYNILTVGMPHPEEEGPAGFETPAAFVASTGLTLPTIDSEWDLTQADWNFSEVPTVYVLNDEHMVEDVLTGDNLVEEINTSLEAVAQKCCTAP